jgi:hypothetical protein
VLCQSILDHASVPVSFMPIALNNLGGIFTRERKQLQSTELSFSRPHAGSQRILGLVAVHGLRHAVPPRHRRALGIARGELRCQCCRHDYQPKEETKSLGQVRTKYEKKNWSSIMLFSNAECTALNPDYVNSATGLQLHQFKWLDSDDRIGSLPLAWNYLAGVYDYDPAAANVHFTEGGPYFPDYADSDYADEWLPARDRVIHVGERPS